MPHFFQKILYLKTLISISPTPRPQLPTVPSPQPQPSPFCIGEKKNDDHVMPVSWVWWMFFTEVRDGEDTPKRIKPHKGLTLSLLPSWKQPFPPFRKVTPFRNSCWEGSEIFSQAHRQWWCGLSQALERAKLEEHIWLTNQQQRMRTFRVYQRCNSIKLVTFFFRKTIPNSPLSLKHLQL